MIKHVPDIKRHIMLVKEPLLAIRITPPFLKNWVIIEIVLYCILWMNGYPKPLAQETL